MAFYRTCPYCHSNLDPGEQCDCRDEEEKIIYITKKKEEKKYPSWKELADLQLAQ